MSTYQFSNPILFLKVLHNIHLNSLFVCLLAGNLYYTSVHCIWVFDSWLELIAIKFELKCHLFALFRVSWLSFSLILFSNKSLILFLCCYLFYRNEQSFPAIYLLSLFPNINAMFVLINDFIEFLPQFIICLVLIDIKDKQFVKHFFHRIEVLF